MPPKLITANSLRDIMGGVSEMTLWRWLQDESLQFPKPVYIGKRRYWKADEVTRWLDSRAKAA